MLPRIKGFPTCIYCMFNNKGILGYFSPGDNCRDFEFWLKSKLDKIDDE